MHSTVKVNMNDALLPPSTEHKAGASQVNYSLSLAAQCRLLAAGSPFWSSLQHQPAVVGWQP